jgi:cobalt ECF transporter T component CbiQ
MAEKTLSIKYYASEFKIILVMFLIFTGLLLPVNFWPAHACLIAFIFIGQSLIKIPLSYLFRRLLLFLPLIMIFSVSIPLTQGFQKGWDIAFLILLRSTVAFMAMLWLIHSMTFDEILTSLQKLRFPPLLLIIISFMFRYCFILWEEMESMRTARRTRTFHKPGMIENWTQSAQLIGMLLIRSLKRSERIHQAMCSRGWNGKIHFLDKTNN